MKKRRVESCVGLNVPPKPNPRRIQGAKHFRLKLECGHTLIRRDRGSVPKRTSCEQCEMLLYRCKLVPDRGWFAARDVQGLLAALKFLEAEGYVESRRDGSHKLLYWRVLR